MARKYGHIKDFKFDPVNTEKYYDIRPILEHDSLYNFIYGERSNGKTTAAISHAIESYVNRGAISCYLRRRGDETKKANNAQIFGHFNNTGLISKATNGVWDRVVSHGQGFYMARLDEKTDKIKKEAEPFMLLADLATSEYRKGGAYSNLEIIIFDEFMTRKPLLNNEVAIFANFVATCVRDRNKMRIYLLANTVTIESVYFRAFKIDKPFEQEQGSVKTYQVLDQKTGMLYNAVSSEFTKSKPDGKASDIYFDFLDGSYARMITKGDFEIPAYPRCPHNYTSSDVKIRFFIEDGSDLLVGRVIHTGPHKFIFIEYFKERCVNDFITNKKDLVYELEPPSLPRHYNNPKRNYGTKSTEIISRMMNQNSVFFRDNIAGEKIRMYLQMADQYSVFNLPTS